jgi:hypothetical protein
VVVQVVRALFLLAYTTHDIAIIRNSTVTKKHCNLEKKVESMILKKPNKI